MQPSDKKTIYNGPSPSFYARRYVLNSNSVAMQSPCLILTKSRAYVLKCFTNFLVCLTGWEPGAWKELILSLPPIVFATRRSPEAHDVGRE